MEKLGEQTWKELLKAVGKNVEDSGRMLKREKAFTNNELQDIENALLRSADTVRKIRESAAGEV